MKEPDKWCIKVTPENREVIEKWRTASAISECKGYCVNKNSFNPSIGYWYSDKPSGYTEISFEEFKIYTSKPKDLTGRYVKCLVDEAQDTNCKAGEIYKLVSLDNIVETQIYKLEDGFCLCISPTTTEWELLPEDYSINKPLKQAVHCKTQEEWDFVTEKLGYKWAQHCSFSAFSESTCISLIDTQYSYVDYLKNDYQILSFQEWCDLNGYKMKKETMFEPGKWYSFYWTWHDAGLVIIKVLSENDNNVNVSQYYRGGFFYDESRFDYAFELSEIKDIKELSIEEIQQYLPDNHIDKIKSNQKFKVGDYVFAVGNIKEYKNPTIGQVVEFNDGDDYDSKVGFNCNNNKKCIIWSNIIRHATPEEIYNYSNVMGQILAEKYPFKKLKEDDLTWEIKTEGNQEFKVGDLVVVLEEDDFYLNSEKCPQKLIEIKEYGLPYKLLFKNGHTNDYRKIRHATEKEMQEYFGNIEAKTYEYFNETLDRMKGKTSKPSYHLLSIDDEELPMVNIIKTNTIKQLLNNE